MTVFFEAVTFGLFVLVVGSGQVSALTSNITFRIVHSVLIMSVVCGLWSVVIIDYDRSMTACCAEVSSVVGQ